MCKELQPTPDSRWILTHDGYSVTTESAVESRFAFGNGFLGMRAARSMSRGPTWASWLGYIRWASWPRCYVAGLFDRPNTEPPVPALVPVADWSRVRLVLDGEPLAARDGEMLHGTRRLDPRLPPHWQSLSFQTRWRDRTVAIRIMPWGVETTLLTGGSMEISIAVSVMALEQGTVLRAGLA